MILDLFAGPGGWDEGIKPLGLRPVGIEWDMAACQTAMAAGHTRVRADVASLPTHPMVGKVTGLIASPPCQAWSMAGKRKGELDRQHCHDLAERIAGGDDSTDWTSWEDVRSPLVCQPVRFIRDLRPEWIALEEVPAVATLWEHFALIFRRWGYSVWTGDLNSADYGVPQTRTRRILIGSRTRQAQPPTPTHAKDPAEDLFGGSVLPWVTMAQALGWGPGVVGFPRRADTPSNRTTGRVTLGGIDYRERDLFPTDGPAQVVTEKTRSWVRMGNQEKSAVRHIEQPAPTVVFGARSNKVEWFHERPPATDDGVRVTVAEGGVLQSFPADYPWQGSRTKQYQQVGNAVPPLLALRVIAEITGASVPSTAVAA